MTAETLTQKNKPKSFVKKRFFNGISENKRLFIVSIVLEIIGLPLLALCAVLDDYWSAKHIKFHPDLDVYLVVGVIAIAISIFMGMIIALYHFKYLYSKSIVDMTYSLPLNTRERFTADYLSGLFVYIVPALCAIVLSIIILLAGESAVGTGSNDVLKVFPELLKAAFLVIIAMILYYTLSVLSITLCGGKFEAVFGIIAVNVLIPATIACLWFAIVSTSAFGLDEESILYSPIFNTTSPAGSASFLFVYLDDVFDEEFIPFTYWRWVITAFITIAIYFFGAYFLYKYRKAEDVSKPYVYKAYFYFIMVSAVFCILSLFIMNDEDNIFGGILLCAIGWFIMEVITRRGFKRFWTAGLGFAAAVGAVFAVCGICNATDGFGASKYVPANMNVSSVSIDCDNSPFLIYENFRDRDVIEAATALNKDIIDRHYHPENYQYKIAANFDSSNSSLENTEDIQRVKLTYKTRTGSTVIREYACTSGVLGNLIQAVILSDEYAEFISDEIQLIAFNNTIEHAYYSRLEDAIAQNTSDTLQIGYSLTGGVNTQQKKISREQLFDLASAYEKDLKELNAEDLKASHEVAEIFGYFVLDCFDDTIEKMNEYGFEISKADSDENFAELKYSFAVISKPVFYSSEINIYSTSSGRYYGHISGHDFTLPEKISSSVWRYTTTNFQDYIEQYPINSTEAMADILSISTPVILGEYPLAVIHSKSGGWYYVTDHGNNKEILEKALKELYE